MAAQTLFDALKAVQNGLTRGLYLEVATSDELFTLMPWLAQVGDTVQYTREKALPTAAFVADAHTTVTSSSATQDLVQVPKRELAFDIIVRNAADAFVGASNRGAQVTKGFKSAGRLIAQKVITGGYATGFTLSNNFQNGAYIDAITAYSASLDSTRFGPGAIRYTHTGTYAAFRAPGDIAFGPDVAVADDGTFTLYSSNPSKWITATFDASDANADMTVEISFTSSSDEFDGLARLMAPGQVISSSGANGDDPSFDTLDQLLDLVKVSDGLAFFMPAAIRRKYMALFRSMGGSNPMTLPNSSKQVPTYSGVPMLKNDWIPVNESKGSASTLSSIYLASLSAGEGLWLATPGGGQRVDVEASPRNATVNGFQLKDLGQIQGGPSADGYRLLWFGCLALGSDLAAARAKELWTATS